MTNDFFLRVIWFYLYPHIYILLDSLTVRVLFGQALRNRNAIGSFPSLVLNPPCIGDGITRCTAIQLVPN